MNLSLQSPWHRSLSPLFPTISLLPLQPPLPLSQFLTRLDSSLPPSARHRLAHLLPAPDPEWASLRPASLLPAPKSASPLPQSPVPRLQQSTDSEMLLLPVPVLQQSSVPVLPPSPVPVVLQQSPVAVCWPPASLVLPVSTPAALSQGPSSVALSLVSCSDACLTSRVVPSLPLAFRGVLPSSSFFREVSPVCSPSRLSSRVTPCLPEQFHHSALAAG